MVNGKNGNSNNGNQFLFHFILGLGVDFRVKVRFRVWQVQGQISRCLFYRCRYYRESHMSAKPTQLLRS